MKIVIGGQVEKKQIENLIKELDSSIEPFVKFQSMNPIP